MFGFQVGGSESILRVKSVWGYVWLSLKSMFQSKILPANLILDKQDFRYFCKLRFDSTLSLHTLIQTYTKTAIQTHT